MSSFDVRDSLAVIHRPRVLGDIVGNQKNVDIISGFLKRRELVKTWMFAGGSGSGKTTTARLLAMILNCQNLGDGIDPCMECPSCRFALANNHPDILELNAAGEEGKVESIRNILNQIKVVPRFNFKVVIVDEAHGLTGKAKEEVLKPLEEPPAKTVWILCTTEPEKLAGATFGRCLKLYWDYPTVSEMAKRLLKISKSAYPDIYKDLKPHLKSIVSAAGNQPRNSISLMESVAAALIASDQNEEDVERIIKNLVSSMGELDGLVMKFVTYLLSKKRFVPMDTIRQLEQSRAQEFVTLVHRYSYYASLWYLYVLTNKIDKFDRKGLWGVNFMRFDAQLQKLRDKGVEDIDLQALKLCSAATTCQEKMRLGLVTNEQALVFLINDYFKG